ncbi:3-deoxy-manno-octulosonate cytidylyltransferase [Candidatus Magnetominusculus xianensis]|uniref:3-deoxy-manno-octulosonate cytidylyltransferase n=1 Tax=Candidatus Magnetominusculus xianensis TaxID=1748249 RepID=A0ABR5SGM9_9BACT|nr:3-deoxy-manno-octulosonate cytidylyltransferase [Candidatus Magnetominusculus xianensis]KWT85577.1 3-deoxy-manno-octulosonate cytidylyltransferase [Candidatus Magnetominusculus xianensis]MBF0404192.1 3-deoxy-manno-octulosonate cytidylyltransferase [Nitrospirota bacterium]
MKAAVIIPSRYASTRFNGKPLALINGLPMIRHVYDNAKKAALPETVIVATDDERIVDAVRAFGGEAIMTGTHHKSGTDRIFEAASAPNNNIYDIIVNVQGDEPLIRPDMIDAVIELLISDSRAGIATLKKRITEAEAIFDPNVVKVVTDADGFAMYFSRAPIPYYREFTTITKDCNIIFSGSTGQTHYYKHIGIYGYRREILQRMAGLTESPLERAESLEQLRAMDNGIRIKVGQTTHETIGVDCPTDIEKVKKWLNTYS